jgi:hypothetical protein
MAKLSGKQLKVKAILDAIGQRLRSGERFYSNQQFETEIKALGYSYKEAERLIVKLAESDVRDAYVESFKGNLPLERNSAINRCIRFVFGIKVSL